MPVDSPIDSKPLKEIKQMLESEKNSSNSTSVDDTSHTFVPTPNVRNGVMILHYNTTLTPSSKAIYSGTKYYDTHIEFHSLFLDVSSIDV